ncbi:MAG: histidine--tRNA ligase [Acidobacteriota bacterium]
MAHYPPITQIKTWTLHRQTERKPSPPIFVLVNLRHLRILFHSGYCLDQFSSYDCRRNQTQRNSMPSPKTQPARGMRDFLPADVRKREYVIGIIKEVYERYGFEPLETPAVENIETLMGKYGEEGNQLIFKILKRGEHEKSGEADLALRYDLTVPLARVVAQYQNELPKFFKRYQIQPVWRADRPARGRFREFYQCDVDVLGSRSMIVEAELISAASDALEALGFNDFTIRVNHRNILTAVLNASNIPPAIHSAVLIGLDKYDKNPGSLTEAMANIGVPYESGLKFLTFLLENVTRFKDLVSRAQEAASRQIADATTVEELDVVDFSRLFMDANESLLDRIAGFTFPSLAAEKAIEDVRKVLQLAENRTKPRRVFLDLTLARGLSYYTGTIMEMNVADLPGSLGGGGRYDNLVGMFSKQSIPACGFSLGLERIITVMNERKMFPLSVVGSPADLMVASFDDESQPVAFTFAAELRAQGLRVLLHPESGNPGKHRVYARDRGIPFMIVIGENERQTGQLILVEPRIRGGQQLPKNEIVSAIRQRLEEKKKEREMEDKTFADAIKQERDKADQ